MLSRLQASLQHACPPAAASQQQQHQLLLRPWQQHQQQCQQHTAHGRSSTSSHAHRVHRSRSSSIRAASALDRLDIKPLSISQEDMAPLTQQTAAAAAAELRIPPVEAWGQDPFLMSGCEPAAAPLRVAVLVSGGVDSSLALKLVTAAGHTATAFYLQIWFQEDFRNFWDACPWEEDLGYAQQVCDALGVPLVVVPLTQQYWDRVVAHSVADIKAGRTPNPDMWCNSRVKFGAFVEYLQQEHAGSFDRIASGHYAKVERQPQQQLCQQQQQQPRQQPQQALGPQVLQQAQGQPQVLQQQHHTQGNSQQTSVDTELGMALLERQASHAQASSTSTSSSSHNSSSEPGSCARLLMVPDAVKDQTYFLADLSPAQLSRCMFPLGSFTKPQVRALAAAAGLATSGRKDSQGICFLGKVKFGEFVAQHLGEWPGPLVEEDSGQVVGVHDGYWFYTVGQRGGIKLPGGPWYVTRKDMCSNTVYVSRTYYEQQRRRDAFVAGPLNWLGPERPLQDRPLLVKVRHGPNMYECSLRLCSREEATAVLEQGSSAVFQPSAGSSSSRIEGSSGNGSSSSNSNSSSTQHSQQAAAGISVLQQQQQQQQQQPQHLIQQQLHGSNTPEFGVVFLSQNDQGLAAGQYAVFYQDQQCLGSAQILGSVATSSSSHV